MRIAAVSFLLFLSGGSALLLQTLWLRLSGLAFGNSVWAAALILSSFMAGLACGSLLAASWQLGHFRALRVYAVLETIVGIFGCTLVFVLPMLGQLLSPLFQLFWSHQQLLNLFRFGISFLVLLIPTTAMGLTLPVLLDDALLGQYRFSYVMGLLYGLNTLGAVAGSLIGEAYLVRKFGLFGTGLTAGAVSCIAGAAAWGFSLVMPAPSGPARARSRLRLSLGVKSLPVDLIVASFATGAIFLCLEVVWFRFLRLYVSSTSTAFSVMLAIVLAGIGLGAISSSVLARLPVPSRVLLPILFLLAALATLLSYLLFPVPALPANRNAFSIEGWPQIARLSLALMFSVAWISGILLPTIVSCVQRSVQHRMNSAGLTIFFNTAGAAVGPIVAAFLLLPGAGFQWTLIICAVSYGVLGLLALTKESFSWQRPSALLTYGLSALLLVLLAVFPYRRDQEHFANARRPYQKDQSVLQNTIQGTADTLQLLRRDLFGQPYYYRLVTNSYSMSGTHPRSQRYMRLFAYLPLALRPHSENALLLCYGVGVTADALLHDQNLKHVDVVDISKEVLSLADSYSTVGYSNPLRDPRVNTFVQDARFFLQATPDHYDIITGEPPPLKVAGTVNLYTEQFFSLMRARLKAGGVASFWLPIYQVTTAETKAILRAFHNVFPNASVWSTCDLDWIMVGMKEPLTKPDPDSARSFWSDSRMTSDLARIGVEVPEQMSALFLMDGDEISRITDSAEPLSDFYPKRLSDVQPDLEAVYRFGHDYFSSAPSTQHFFSSSLIKTVWPNQWKSSLDLFFLVRETRLISEMSGSNWLAELDLYLRQTKLRTPVLAVLSSDEFRLVLAERFARDSRSVPPGTYKDLIAGALAQRDLTGAIRLLEEKRAKDLSTPDDQLLLIYIYCVSGQTAKAETLAAEGVNGDELVVQWLWRKLQAEYGFRPPK